ncbi:hypothetical protein [Undibacterium luofuense]|uniref:hypothetical protein n=1 Tax=Undibacterium luofuense TaxID=2828733 RepID=UPI0030EE804B
MESGYFSDPVEQGDEQSSPCFFCVFAPENSKKSPGISYREKSRYFVAAQTKSRIMKSHIAIWKMKKGLLEFFRSVKSLEI